MGGILTTLPDNDRWNYRYRSYYLLCDRISDPMVIFYYQCSSDDICHPYARSPIQYKNYVRHLYADIPALAFPINSQQLYSGTGYDTGRQTVLLGPGQDFMACIIGAAMCGVGLGITFNYNGSTGGTDIIAAIVNKYKDVSLGRMIMICDVVIISSCYFIFHDWRRVIFGFVTLFIIGVVLDWIINSARQSVQFLIFSKKYDEIADHIIKDTNRGVTVLDGTGWYSKGNVKVLVVLAKKRQSLDIFRMVKRIDPNAFISQSSVIGVYGEGFDKLK